LLILLTAASSTLDGQAPRPNRSELWHPVLFNTREADEILAALRIIPPDSPWNEDISRWPVAPYSRAIIASIGAGKPLRCNLDMGFVLVPPGQQKVPVKIEPPNEESDPGPFPVPANLPIEGWPVGYPGKTLEQVQRTDMPSADRHGLVIDPVAARGAAVFDLKSSALRPAGWTSADAAGLPIFPLVVRYDELQRGTVEHAMRVTVRRTRRAYVYPARHFASRSNDRRLPRMGERLRLRRDYDISRFSPQAQAILKGLKKYGMFVADNGVDWAISVTPDQRIPDLHEELRRVKGSAFEVVSKR
jgi:hypothetical protein